MSTYKGTGKSLPRQKFCIFSHWILWQSFYDLSAVLWEFMWLAIMYYWEIFLCGCCCQEKHWRWREKANTQTSETLSFIHLRLLFFMCRNNNSWCANFCVSTSDNDWRARWERHAIIIKFDDTKSIEQWSLRVRIVDEMLRFPLRLQCLIKTESLFI